MTPAPRHALPSIRPALAAVLAGALSALAACASAPRQAPAPAPEPAPVAAAPAQAPAVAPAVTDSAVRAISERLLADSPGVARPTLPAPRYALDVDVSPFESHDKVARYVALFTGEGRERFAARLEKGTRFDAMIRRRLRIGGLPEDLTYLALVESGYDPNAVSRASAVGMWQFMAATARDIGLRVDWWVDERRDPVKATDAAVKNLRWLRKEFGSLFLAAAAYNGGPGRVARGLAQLAALSDSSVGDSRFFALAEEGLLRPETVNYVPQIIAASLVASEPARYGISVQPLSPFVYDSVFVRELTPLAAVATAARATREELLDLNPQILRGMTPPGEGTLVRLPLGASTGFATRLSALSTAERRAFRGVATKAGQTVDAVAKREKVPASEIRRFNPRLATVKKGKRKGTLVAGQTLRIPTAAVLAYARPIGDVDGDGPTALPKPVVLAEATPAVKVTKDVPSVRSSEDGGDVEPEPSKPAKAKKPVAKSATKVASKAGGRSIAKSTAKSSAKGSTKAVAKGAAKPAAKSASKAASKTIAKSSAKPSVKKPVAKSASKSSSKSASKPAAKSASKGAAKGTAKADAKKGKQAA